MRLERPPSRTTVSPDAAARHALPFPSKKAQPCPTDGRFVAVCGGVNLDIGARPFAKLIARDSNPARVTMAPGGVGRNIAERLAAFGVQTELLTALGDDANGDFIRRHAASLGENFSLRHALTVAGGTTGVYLYITDETGDMALAANDMEILAALTPAWWNTKLDLLNRAAAVVLDANLPADALAYLCKHVTRPLITDPVSAAKARRLTPLLPRLHVITPNRLEAEALTGLQDPEAAARSLLDAGVARVFVTLGAHGVLCGEGKTLLRIPAPAVTTDDATGAGDCFTAALAAAHLQALSLEDAARFAVGYVTNYLFRRSGGKTEEHYEPIS